MIIILKEYLKLKKAMNDEWINFMHIHYSFMAYILTLYILER